MLTKDEFESAYADRSGVTVEALHDRGRYAEACDCGEPGCEGWAMGYQWEDAIVDEITRTDAAPKARARIVPKHVPEPEPEAVEMRGKTWRVGTCAGCNAVRLCEERSGLCPTCLS